MEVGLALLVCAFGGVAHRFGPLVDAARFASTASASELRSKVPQRGREQDGSWCSKEALATLTAELAALSAEPASWWTGAPRALSTMVCAEDRCLVSLFAIPDGCRVPLRKHPVGTVIFHRALAGAFELSRWQLSAPDDRNQRPPVRVMKRESGWEAEHPLATFGGLAQELGAARGGACAVLEVALLSPVVPTTGLGAVELIGGNPSAGSSAVLPSFPSSADDAADTAKGSAESGDTAAALREPLQMLEAESAEQLLTRVVRSLDSVPADTSAGAAAGAGAARRRAESELVSSPLERLSLAIGGLAPELAAIDRRLLAPRQQSAELLDALGVSVPKGLLLHGPPGCGKTLLAREIAKALGAASVQVVSGPEMMSRFVGESERWVRELFEPAERDAIQTEEQGGRLAAGGAGEVATGRAAAAAGDRSTAARLHVIILDELDAFSRERGSLLGDPGIRDSIVNTLLAKMDGVRALNNLLVIGTTNRIELIDRALLRAGRFEVHVQVRAPDAAGRREVLGIHTRRMRQAGLLAPEAASNDALARLSELTDGFTGADIAGLVRAAASRALQRATARAGDAGAEGREAVARPVVLLADLERACAEVGAQTQAVRERRALAAAQCPTHEWDANDVCAWLSEAGLDARAQAAFREQAIDGRALCQLHRLDGAAQERLLGAQLRVEPLGERLRFLHALGELMARPVALESGLDPEPAWAAAPETE